jgi:hypothetical protein
VDDWLARLGVNGVRRRGILDAAKTIETTTSNSSSLSTVSGIQFSDLGLRGQTFPKRPINRRGTMRARFADRPNQDSAFNNPWDCEKSSSLVREINGMEFNSMNPNRK